MYKGGIQQATILTPVFILGVSLLSCANYQMEQSAGSYTSGTVATPADNPQSTAEIMPGNDLEHNGTLEPMGTDPTPALLPNSTTTPIQAGAANNLLSIGYFASEFDPTACLDHPNTTYDADNYLLQVWSCNNTTTQLFNFGVDGSLIDPVSSRCLTGDALKGGNEKYVSLSTCSVNLLTQKWDRAGKNLINRQTKQCLDLISGNSNGGQKLQLARCAGTATQNWIGPRSLDEKAVDDSTPQANSVAGRCTPQLFVLNYLDDANKNTWNSYFPDIASVIRKSIQANCGILFSTPSDVPPSRGFLKIVIEPEIEAAAFVRGAEVHINALYFIQNARAGNFNEGPGVLHHEMTHYYQVNTFGVPTWLTEGMADYVRYRSGYLPITNRRKGGAYTDSYQVTGFFLDYVERMYPGTMRKLELDLWQKKGGWNLNWFAVQTGKNIDTLWNSYQRSF